jgi:putative Holliday junction resolvase
LSELVIIIKDNNISGIVVGNPINMDGTSGASAHSVKDTVNLLSKNITLPITLWDERLSSTGAYKLSSQLDIKAVKKIKTIDQNAAAFILQGAIDFINN